MEKQETLEGIIERVTFQAEETGYAVFKLKVPRSQDLATVVGNMPPLYAGESVRLFGIWGLHPKHGAQFKAFQIEKLMPATAVGLEKYLASGLIKGVGPVTAKRLVKAFGLEIIDVIETAPERLLEVSLIGPRKRDMIVRSWFEHREIQNVMVFLQEHGVSTTYAVKIYKKYGNEAIAIVQANPYRLAEEIWGIGFKTADKLAQELGHAPDSPFRLRAGLIYALQRATDEGHLYLPRSQLFENTAELLAIEPGLLPEILTELGQADQVILEGEPDNPAIYLASLWHAEAGVARRLKGLLAQSEPPDPQVLLQWLESFEKRQGMELAPEQREAVRQAASQKVFILTGGPGTGKTTVSKAIIGWFEAQNRKLLLASPTGRAAKRLNEVTGRPAKTLHRLLEFDPSRQAFKRDEHFPLEVDVLLLDEVSMIDLPLFHFLLKALPAEAHLILVGDSDQLPSVGPGAVLQHLLQSQVIPSVCLQQIFRQAQASLIVRNAHRVNQGYLPELLPPTGAHRSEDCFFIPAETPEEVLEQILDLVARRLPAAGFSAEEIQLLCPMNRGLIGAHRLNQELQAILNPATPQKSELTRGSRTLRLGDRVIQLRNNYDREVFNGDMGELVHFEPEDQLLRVRFPEGVVEYDFSDSDELALAYALSVHKSQGSEYPVVILPVSMQHYLMLQRNLIYTAMTRARRLLILVGQRKALALAVKNQGQNKRFSHLADRLEQA
ncbi:ATP-dependent RecD-like DNA helicase [bacterium (Candidatus Blackallbacteria) CG17_big_fil_post_rev_8_21_14_2_50_48_46]|uniref:ATP-dependent RecD-like DNA helicase n=1 Tax=bacterium (Candidatus Blackallbacteria) CG17_big_fil_post_rev_8_21_14_2_50_48_46 TaxID=2014261 RepID=A0A2M7GB80_9BACT|nr:MAG: ATP-dependent RecD-like DNA helicase [bacterium (Candidatus Blackallbacteria) CG18_big_fil_WC_8_21_14_2_50_49_26]PIW19434.1 MAG: ATP-dependent RecD-like DNA helicase [bacterium (Candidatus Blackallbacteria) CG17_big_fil_post_rev_8_21_14_2_50_48_46]PIW48962.1 MAG: ATP-dependent RecD-like DNA helicase [bacterium (Candidatus Blackallbacteria) CG13_big_fil_rev_8_21_14_2_50_49_14]